MHQNGKGGTMFRIFLRKYCIKTKFASISLEGHTLYVVHFLRKSEMVEQKAFVYLRWNDLTVNMGLQP